MTQESADTKRTQAKKDAQQLLGTADKKAKKKSKVEKLEPPGAKSEASLAPVLERKPLPGIKPLGGLGTPLGSLSRIEINQDSKATSHSSLQDPPPKALELPKSSELPEVMTLRTSSKLGVIGSLRASGENQPLSISNTPTTK